MQTIKLQIIGKEKFRICLTETRQVDETDYIGIQCWNL